jgi:hypothetical protein
VSGLVWVTVVLVLAQADEAAPRLPKQATAAPASFRAGCPFDLDAFFQAPPPDDDSAPLYLVALSEFDDLMEKCWPGGFSRERKATLRERTRALGNLVDALDRDPEHADRAALEETLAPFREGWEGLVRAQKRGRCVFPIGIGIAADTPHIAGARGAARVGRLRVLLHLDRGDVDAALDDLAVVLRLSRDLRPRGNAICQIASVALDASACTQMAVPILRAPGLEARHCDRLITLLGARQRAALDLFRECLCPEYLAARSILMELKERADLRARFAGFLKRDGLGAIAGLFNDLIGEGPNEAQQEASARQARRAAERLERMTDADFDRVIAAVGAYYRALLEMKATTHAGRAARIPAMAKETLGDDPLQAAGLVPDPATARAIATVAARDTFHLNAAQLLAAVRRWQLTHGGAMPASAAEAARAAGLDPVPADPLADGPLKLTTLDGAPAVYSIGLDGKDDGGQVDAVPGSRIKKEGDWILRLAPRPQHQP